MKLPCTLKLRHTGSDTKGGGVGPMVTENLSCTLAAAVQDQTLITGGGTAYGINPVMSGVMMETKPAEETAQTLRKSPGGENGIVQSLGFKAGQSANGGLGDEREVAPTLSHQPSALEPTVCCNGPQPHSTTRGFGVDVAPTMGAAAGDSGNNKPFMAQSQCDLAAMRYIVRRLTPKEAERLMGLPDGYTIPVGLDPNNPALVEEFRLIHDTFNAIMAAYEGGKPPKPKTVAQVQKWLAKITNPETCPDSPRYKACGNGWATNQPRWILMRLLYFTEQENTQTTQTQKEKDNT